MRRQVIKTVNASILKDYRAAVSSTALPWDYGTFALTSGEKELNNWPVFRWIGLLSDPIWLEFHVAMEDVNL